MEFIEKYSLFEVVAGAVFMFATIIPALQIKKNVPSDLRRELQKITSFMCFFLAGYVFFFLIQFGNIAYPLKPVATSMFLASACFIYAIVTLTKTFAQRINEKDAKITGYIEGLREKGEMLEHEIDERKRAQEALLIFEKALKTTRNGITVCDCSGKILYINTADAEMHGYLPEELTGKDAGIFAPPSMRKPIRLDRLKEATWVRESLNVRKDGSLFPVRLTSDVVRNDAGEPVGIVTTCEDITEKKQSEEKLHLYQAHLEELVGERTRELSDAVHKLEDEIKEHRRSEEKVRYLAYYDTLTGLPNRIMLVDRLNMAVENARRQDKLAAVLFLDLDNFKRINDTLGHSTGDRLLKGVAERLTSNLRKTDTVSRLAKDETVSCISRLGGDEYVILLTNISRMLDTVKVAGRIIRLMGMPFKLGGQDLFISTSIGITIFPHDGADADTLLKNADTAMYHAKEQGRNNYQFYSHSMNEAALERLVLESNLRVALKHEEFLLYYQPQVDAGSGKLIGVEALVRWKHPELGILPPSQFIPILEDTGMIIPVGAFILRSACEQNKAWQSAGLPPVRVTVNVSGYQFRQKRLLLDTVADALRANALDPRYLELEITESVIMNNIDENAKTLTELKVMGVNISIDDFGTGYSSLSYLRRLPLDTLKVDASFVRDISTDPDAASITKTIIAMAHSLNLRVIAEGVETEQQFEFLREHGCDGIQGYLFSRPLPAEDIAKLIADKDFRTRPAA